MKIEFEGIDDLIKEFTSLASERQQEETNDKIIKKCAKVVEKNLMPEVHKSRDVSKSGIKGMKTGKHAADHIEKKKINKGKGIKFIEVGWDQSKTKPFSYMQWEVWGNTTREPHVELYPIVEGCIPEMNKIAKQEYEDIIKKLK